MPDQSPAVTIVGNSIIRVAAPDNWQIQMRAAYIGGSSGVPLFEHTYLALVSPDGKVIGALGVYPNNGSANQLKVGVGEAYDGSLGNQGNASDMGISAAVISAAPTDAGYQSIKAQWDSLINTGNQINSLNLPYPNFSSQPGNFLSGLFANIGNGLGNRENSNTGTRTLTDSLVGDAAANQIFNSLGLSRASGWENGNILQNHGQDAPGAPATPLLPNSTAPQAPITPDQSELLNKSGLGDPNADYTLVQVRDDGSLIFLDSKTGNWLHVTSDPASGFVTATVETPLVKVASTDAGVPTPPTDYFLPASTQIIVNSKAVLVDDGQGGTIPMPVDLKTGLVSYPGATKATIDGNTVTLITPTTPDSSGVIPPIFAVIQSTDASASSSNVLAYPQGPVARTAGRSYRRRVGSLGISHDRGSARTDRGARLWGFIRRESGGGSDSRRRIGARGCSSVQTASGFGGTEHVSSQNDIVNSVSTMSAAHTQRLPGRIGPVTMSRSHDRTAHGRCHDVSLGFGGLG